MTIINVNEIKIISWTVDVASKSVIVSFSYNTDTDEIHDFGSAIFWETIPGPQPNPEGGPDTVPDNWYQLPAKYTQILTDLTIDVRAALLHLLD